MKYGLIILLILLMTGCNSKELENRDYVMAMAIETENQYKLTLSVASLNEGDKDSNGSSEYIVTGTGETINDAIKNANTRTKGDIYLGHCRAIVLSQDFNSYNDLMNYVDGNIDLSRDMIVVEAQKPSEIIQLKNNETMASDYIHSYFENKDSIDLNDIMDSYSNGRDIALPAVVEENEQIYIK